MPLIFQVDEQVKLLQERGLSAAGIACQPSRPSDRPRSFDTIHCGNLWKNRLCSTVCRCSVRSVQIVCNDAEFWTYFLFVLVNVVNIASSSIDVLYYWILAAPATGPTLEVLDSLYDKIFDTNVKSFWSFTQEVLPHLQPFASFVFISSVGAYDPAPPSVSTVCLRLALSGWLNC